MKKWLVIIAVAFSVGCEAKGLRQVDARVASGGESTITVEVLAEFDGIRLYRVNGDTRPIYVAKSISTSGVEVSAHWNYTTGGKAKTAHYSVVPTLK